MNKNTIVSVLFVVLALIVAGGSIYLILSYATDMLNAIVTFVSTNNLTDLEKCGMNMPSEFAKVRAELATLILPFLYIGMPAILIVVGILMFLAGFYFHKSRHEDEAKKKEQIEREMVHKLVRKLEVGKSQPPSELQDVEPAPPEPEPPVMEVQSEPQDELAPEYTPKPKAARASKRKK
jgi:hypothetical protein